MDLASVFLDLRVVHVEEGCRFHFRERHDLARALGECANQLVDLRRRRLRHGWVERALGVNQLVIYPDETFTLELNRTVGEDRVATFRPK